jgi:hypothetical protein
LRAFYHETERLRSTFAYNKPPVTSRQREWRDRQGDIKTRTLSATPVANAHTSLFLLWSAALDHSDAFAQIVSSGHHRTSLATLLRASAEAFGQAYWLLDAKTPDDLVARYIMARHSELSWKRKHTPNAILRDQDGRDETVVSLSHEYELDLAQLTFEPTKTPTYSDGAARALVPTNPTTGRLIYSDLSSMAHAEPMGFTAFLDFGPNGETYADLPAPVLVELCSYAFIMNLQFIQAFAMKWNHPLTSEDQWTRVKEDAADALRMEQIRILGT